MSCSKDGNIDWEGSKEFHKKAQKIYYSKKVSVSSCLDTYTGHSDNENVVLIRMKNFYFKLVRPWNTSKFQRAQELFTLDL